MNNAEFGWQSLLHSDAPSGCPLKAALFTTYDRADERLLAEHLLPLLLKLDREPETEGVERQYFLLELNERLKRLHDRLVVVSSTSREEPTDADENESVAYGWLWRSIRHLTVGRRSRAVQHAKLWLFHWGAGSGKDEYLEIIVSSTNLTMAAFKGQLQAAWRVCLKLGPRSDERLAGWGILPDFLRELAIQAGDDKRLGEFVELLARADCPAGVTFVASVPGRYSSQDPQRTLWGAAGLQGIVPSGQGKIGVKVLAPFVGTWQAEALNKWCSHFAGSADRFDLIWIDKAHPWAKQWILPQATLKTLAAAGARLRRLHQDAADSKTPGPFHNEHRSADDRWGHAKVYCFQRSNSRRLLVTSANFSPAAWGRQDHDGNLLIENFELGVCIEQAVWPFAGLEPFSNLEDAATVAELPSHGSALITWARAAWDGTNVDVLCRCQAGSELEGSIGCGGERQSISHWNVDADGCLRSARVSWTDAKRPPSFVRLTCEQETKSIPIFDDRPQCEREDAHPPEVDEDVARRMRDELLFEQYGGRVADEEGDESAGCLSQEGDDEDQTNEPEHSDSYAVQAFVDAREYLGLVDNWAAKVDATLSGTGQLERQWLKRDGELLVEAFQRQAERDGNKGPASKIGANLAAEELGLRLNHFQE